MKIGNVFLYLISIINENQLIFKIYSSVGSKPDPKEVHSLVKHRYASTSFLWTLSSTLTEEFTSVSKKSQGNF